VDILVRGRRVASGSVKDVLATKATGQVRVVTGDLPLAAKTLETAGMTVLPYPDHLIVSDVGDPAAVTKALAQKKQYVSELTPLTANLESVFLELTGGVQ
jgi:ABC-2 type transport system ATP-binding protein